jgi:hypothetical protein
MKKHLQATRRRIRRIITFSYLIFPWNSFASRHN